MEHDDLILTLFSSNDPPDGYWHGGVGRACGG
jgi:hypothetical protein